ncbi:chromate efflux transporter [Roseovarius sp. A21]|uniref:Chromate efflux transporter n=1 Tax=Roseovarius bejariae TaxID=2576383 RepID=A0A844CHJ2_9RHOB|nr:chromate efflux transporter [Roseovarius bejariae]MRU14097.1 chromate efflux transporter [Roseovarius bejariae]
MQPSYGDLFRVFGRIGLLSFGGPAAQIALMHTELVDRHKWLKEQQFLGALSFCMLLPGPEAMQLATYAGWRLRGTLGGLIAGGLFVVPGALVILGLAMGYAAYGQVPVIQSLFLGIKATVVVIVLQALLSLSRRALKGWDSWALAGLGFVAMFFFSVPFPAIIIAAAFWGFTTQRADQNSPHEEHPVIYYFKTIKTIILWLVIWATPIVTAWAMGATFLTEIALFFSKLAVVTFGGAYAVLAYMTQAVVETHGWLTTPEMIDALGLAETTPGPLILVTQFVGHLAGHHEGGAPLALSAGVMALWVTFTPCFLWIFAGAPYVETLLARPRLKEALAAISAAVVGVILNLSVWFALHVVFQEVATGQFGPSPNLSSFSPMSAIFIAVASVLHLYLRLSMIRTLCLMVGLVGMLHFVI